MQRFNAVVEVVVVRSGVSKVEGYLGRLVGLLSSEAATRKNVGGDWARKATGLGLESC